MHGESTRYKSRFIIAPSQPVVSALACGKQLPGGYVSDEPPWSTPYSKPTQPGVSRQCCSHSAGEDTSMREPAMLAPVTQAWGWWVAGCWMYSILPSSLPVWNW